MIHSQSLIGNASTPNLLLPAKKVSTYVTQIRENPPLAIGLLDIAYYPEFKGGKPGKGEGDCTYSYRLG